MVPQTGKEPKFVLPLRKLTVNLYPIFLTYILCKTIVHIIGSSLI